MTTTSFTNPADLAPSGIIRPFFGSQPQVPEGWAVCDGNNGTPDLRSKFIKGTPDTSTVAGATGGENSKTVAEAQLPSHTHGGSTDSAGSHSQTWSYATQDNDTSFDDNDIAAVDQDNGDVTVQSTNNGGHSHSMNVYSTGGDGSSENRPNMVETLFIKKL